jgi:His-Xaa-Ser system protein HxsD
MTAAPTPTHTFIDGRCSIDLDVRTYRTVAIQKAAYRLADRCTVEIGVLRDTSLTVTLVLRPGVSESGSAEAVRLFFQELLDQELREQLAEESQPLRALILAHAFSRTDLVRRQ